MFAVWAECTTRGVVQYPGSKDKGDVTASRPKGVTGGNLERNF